MIEKYTDPAKEVREAAGLLERLVGGDYFKKETELLKKGDPAGAGMGRYSDPAALNTLAYIWLKAREELIFGEISGSFKGGYASARLTALGRDLAGLSKTKNIEIPIKQLQSREDFENACFTLAVASGYAGMGLTVEFCPNPEQKTSCINITGDKTGCVINCRTLDLHLNTTEFIDLNVVRQTFPQPELLYLNILMQRPVDFNHSQLFDSFKNCFRDNGKNIFAVVPSQGKLSAGGNGLTFFRESRPFINPGRGQTFDFDIYLPR